MRRLPNGRSKLGRLLPIKYRIWPRAVANSRSEAGKIWPGNRRISGGAVADARPEAAETSDLLAATRNRPPPRRPGVAEKSPDLGWGPSRTTAQWLTRPGL